VHARQRETPSSWPTAGLSFGGDWSPEQWDADTWREDIALMREAGVTLMTVGVFSWGLFEPEPGVYDWAWFDEVLDLLHEAGISVDLATPTAAPPSWLLHRHPEIMPVQSDMHTHQPGGRLGWCPSSPTFRGYALGIVEALAARYGTHPAVRLWHLGNEYGGGNDRCFCDVSAGRFREWLEEKYGDVERVNAAWGTAFWGHRFSSFAEIVPPRGIDRWLSPATYLDYRRFSSDELLAHFSAEAEVVRRYSAAPITTNFMVGSGAHVVDYSTWAKSVDIVANDHYTRVSETDRHKELAFSADRMRGLTVERAPWLLMEHSTGAPIWQQRNRAKDPGEILRNSLAHVARGSDGALFFQWRASTAGAEQFHSAMLPHAGTRTRVWREIVELGRILRESSGLRGSRVAPARVALLADEESAWAVQHGLKPVADLRYEHEPRAWHAAFWDRNILVDVLPADRALDGYDVVVIPTLYIAGPERAARIRDYVAGGGTVVVTYLSGIADDDSRIIPGGYPGAFRDILGAWTEEFRPLQIDETVRLSDGSEVAEWTEDVVLEGADVVLAYATGSSTGRPAVTRHRFGAGTAWYVSARLSPGTIGALVDGLAAEHALSPTADAPSGVEVVRRVTDDGRTYLFAINHTSADAIVPADGHELVTAASVSGVVHVPAGSVRIVSEERS
jgi:beta-galactosidase